MAWMRCAGNTGGSLKVRTASGSVASFETNLAEPLQSVKCEINASGGNGTPDNPNPINGYTEANIIRCGVNLWDEEWEVGSIDPTTGATFNDPARIRSKNFSPIKGGIEIYTLDPTNNYDIKLFYYDVNKNYLSASIWLGNQTSTTPEGACYFKFIMGSSYGTTYHNDLAVLYPSNNHAYAPYNGQTCTIAFGQTVYGGVLDVTRGTLTVNRWFMQKTWGEGAGTPALTNYTRRTFAFPTVDYNVYPPSVGMPQRCNVAEYLANYSSETLHFYCNTREAILFLPNGTPDDTVVQFSGELATPFDIDLTPVQIEALLGVNNVWHDGNGDTEVKFLEVVRS